MFNFLQRPWRLAQLIKLGMDRGGHSGSHARISARSPLGHDIIVGAVTGTTELLFATENAQ